VLAGPLVHERGILTADLDLRTLSARKRLFDAAGHYNRPDVFHLIVDDRAKATVTILSQGASNDMTAPPLPHLAKESPPDRLPTETRPPRRPEHQTAEVPGEPMATAKLRT
jgi:hypothetical protein